ncbi:hypothetical protein F2P79_013253 [Pimephales promelas]|nr:hypothetical protein F2P79_013253 [Pimephales promelas]
MFALINHPQAALVLLRTEGLLVVFVGVLSKVPLHVLWARGKIKMYTHLLVHLLNILVPKKSRANSLPLKEIQITLGILMPLHVSLAKVPSDGFFLYFPATTDKLNKTSLKLTG